jgi:hypothetical protein
MVKFYFRLYEDNDQKNKQVPKNLTDLLVDKQEQNVNNEILDQSEDIRTKKRRHLEKYMCEQNKNIEVDTGKLK